MADACRATEQASTRLALFDDGGRYEVQVLQGPLKWAKLEEILSSHEDGANLGGRIASRAGGLNVAGEQVWYAVLYVHHGNCEWVPATWLVSRSSEGAVFREAWGRLWHAPLLDFHAKHFLPSPSKPEAVEGAVCRTEKAKLPPALVQPLKRRPKNVSSKFWVQRRLLWSRWDYGILMDTVGWFSVTPEPAARQIAQLLGPMKWPVADHCARTNCKGVVVDAFAGVGGNAIQFALHCCSHGGGPATCPLGTVVAIESSSERLQQLRHNASIYGIDSCELHGKGVKHVPPLLCVQGDSMTQLQQSASQLKSALAAALQTKHAHIGAIFLAPPWGGELYSSRTPSLAAISVQGDSQAFDGCDIFWCAAQAADTVLYYLPRQCSLDAVLRELSAHSAADRSLAPDCPGVSVQWKPITSHGEKVIAKLLVVCWT